MYPGSSIGASKLAAWSFQVSADVIGGDTFEAAVVALVIVTFASVLRKPLSPVFSVDTGVEINLPAPAPAPAPALAYVSAKGLKNFTGVMTSSIAACSCDVDLSRWSFVFRLPSSSMSTSLLVRCLGCLSAGSITSSIGASSVDHAVESCVTSVFRCSSRLAALAINLALRGLMSSSLFMVEIYSGFAGPMSSSEDIVGARSWSWVTRKVLLGETTFIGMSDDFVRVRTL